MITIIVLSAVAVILSCWQYWRWKNWRLLELSNKLPGPKAYPLVGNALVFMANPRDHPKLLTEIFTNYGDYVRFWLGPDLIVGVKNPADIRALLTGTKVNQKGPLYAFTVNYIGPGILSGGPTWRKHRKIVNPTYNKKSVKHFSDIFNLEAELLVDSLLKKDPKIKYNVYDDVVQYTTQCVCLLRSTLSKRGVIGVQFTTLAYFGGGGLGSSLIIIKACRLPHGAIETLMGLAKKDSRKVYRLQEIIKETPNIYNLMFTRMTRWWYHIPFIYWITGKQSLERWYLKLVDDVITDIVSKRRRCLQEDGLVDEEQMGVVDRMILSGELSEREIKEESFTLFTTSQEAAAKMASAVLLFLARLPDWQDKVHSEILQVVGDDAMVTEDHLKQLHHLDMVFKEATRYLSIAAMIQRTVEEDVTLDNGKIVVPAGASILIPLQDLHRDPRYWELPNKVMPERFLPENSKNRDPNTFVPFSLGPMDCLGRVFSTALIKIMVVKVLLKIQLETDEVLEDLELQYSISVKFLNGYNLRTRPRSL